MKRLPKMILSLAAFALSFTGLLCAPQIQVESTRRTELDCETIPGRPQQEGVRTGSEYNTRIDPVDRAVSICPAAKNTRGCQKIQLQPALTPAVNSKETIEVLVNRERSALVVLRIVAAGEYIWSVHALGYAISNNSGRLIRDYDIEVQSLSASLFTMLDDLLYIRDCVGAGPGCSGTLYPVLTKQRKPFSIGHSPRDSMNVYEGSEIPIAPGIWAFVSSSGNEVVWMDLKRGRAIRREIISDLAPGISSAQAFPWLEEYADPGAGNFAYKRDGQLRIVYGLTAPESYNGSQKELWQLRLNLTTGGLLGKQRIQLCPSL